MNQSERAAATRGRPFLAPVSGGMKRRPSIIAGLGAETEEPAG